MPQFSRKPDVYDWFYWNYANDQDLLAYLQTRVGLSFFARHIDSYKNIYFGVSGSNKLYAIEMENGLQGSGVWVAVYGTEDGVAVELAYDDNGAPAGFEPV